MTNTSNPLSWLAKKTIALVLDKSVEIMAGSLTSLFLMFGDRVYKLIAPQVSLLLSPQFVLLSLIVSISLNAVAVAYLFLARQGGLTFKYGVCWDRFKNPYCPHCKNPVVYGDYADDNSGYSCVPCNRVFKLMDNTGKHYLPSDVIKRL